MAHVPFPTPFPQMVIATRHKDTRVSPVTPERICRICGPCSSAMSSQSFLHRLAAQSLLGETGRGQKEGRKEGKGREGKEKEKERKGKERKGKERKGKERKGKKGKERKGRKMRYFASRIGSLDAGWLVTGNRRTFVRGNQDVLLRRSQPHASTILSVSWLEIPR